MKKLGILLGILALSVQLYAEKITVFAAADLRYALEEVKGLYLKGKKGKEEIETIYGSSGKGMHQIENGAPYHLYFSANESFVEKLYKEGHAVEAPKLYAVGRVVIWSTNPQFDASKGFENLKASWVKKIAIANPAHAPYGEKAKQALEKIGIYEAIRPQLVFGENISHTAQFVQSGAAEVGVIALSLALAPSIAEGKTPSYFLIDHKLHDPLLQGYSITRYGKDSALAKDFYQFIQTPEAKEILKRYGFDIPSEFQR